MAESSSESNPQHSTEPMAVAVRPPRASLQVAKLGGSLLDAPGWRERLDAWWAQPAPAVRIVLAGGGALVDVLRKRHAEQSLPEELSHKLALQAMQLNTLFLWERWPSSRRLDLAELRRLAALRDSPASPHSSTPWVLEPWPLLDDRSWLHPLGEIPRTWDATSDTLAAWLAGALAADELVLLKSCLPPQGATLSSAAQCGYVDASFPRFAAILPQVRCVDLSAPGAPSTTLLP